MMRLALLLLISSQAPRELPFFVKHPVVLENINYEDSELVTRFAGSEGIRSLTSISRFDEMYLFCSPLSADKMLSDFRKALGFQPRFGPTGGPYSGPPFPRLALNVDSPGSPARFWRRFHVGGLLPMAYRELISNHSISARDRISACNYVLRPWITEDLSRTECVEGFFDVVTQSGPRTVDFLYFGPHADSKKQTANAIVQSGHRVSRRAR
jgi:hypothetical protein